MTLSDIERHSALWKKINEYLHERMDVARRKNDGDLTEAQTAKIRGQIQTLKELIALGNPSPIEPADES